MVQEPVENRARNHRIAKDLAPGSETLIAGHEDGALLVAATDQLEEEIHPLPVDRDVADLVDDEEPRLGEQLEPFLEAVLVQGRP